MLWKIRYGRNFDVQQNEQKFNGPTMVNVCRVHDSVY